MSFLAPWFVVAGVAAVALPILFHLFRRTPRGRLPFSTLMFLTPSPPRLTSRSRLENWPLLLMRAAILVLLALAFGRPLWRQLMESQNDAPAGTRIVLLVDTSASMRRGDLWSQAVSEAAQIINAAGPHDELCLMAFDSTTRTPLSLETWRKAPVGERSALAQAALGELSAGWSATRLDQALITAAELLDTSEEAAQPGDAVQSRDAASPVNRARAKQIVLITDLQFGGRTAGLQSFEWPKHVDVKLVAVVAKTSNAGLHPLETAEAVVSADVAASRPRVLVTNAANSKRESFELTWQSPTPAATGTKENDRPTPTYVPPGQTRVVRAPALPAGESLQLVLRGDDEPFDNGLWLVPPVKERVRVLHLADEKADDPQSLRYFLERAFSDPAAGRIVTVETLDPRAPGVRVPTERDLDDVALVVVALPTALAEPWNEVLRAWTERGGVIAAVLLTADDAAWRALLPESLREPRHIRLAEGDRSREYALLGEIDLKHPLFAPLADPRFSDFTKIRFWRHRRLTLDDIAARRLRVLARFDSGVPGAAGDPAVLEMSQGTGRVVLFASGWQPRESRLGVSSKFVPLVTTLVDLGRRHSPPSANYDAGTIVDLAQLDQPPPPAVPVAASSGTMNSGTSSSDQKSVQASATPTATAGAPLRSIGPWIVKNPAGGETNVATDASRFALDAGPGIYEVRSPAGLRRLAVNIAADESKTAPLGVEALEALGIRLAKETPEATPELVAERQTLQLQEIESRQQLWRVALAAALVMLLVETWYAGRVARQLPV